HSIGNRGAAPADLKGDIFLPHAKFARQTSITLRFFDWVQISSLQVLDQRELKNFQIGRHPDDDRNLAESQFLRRAPTALAGNQFVPTITLPNYEWLNNPMLPNGINELSQGVRRKFLARLERARCD